MSDTPVINDLTWCYIGHRHWALQGKDGELVAEVTGGFPPGVWTFNRKRYWGENKAKEAAMKFAREQPQE